jgi:hypothetical protein
MLQRIARLLYAPQKGTKGVAVGSIYVLCVPFCGYPEFMQRDFICGAS